MVKMGPLDKIDNSMIVDSFKQFVINRGGMNPLTTTNN